MKLSKKCFVIAVFSFSSISHVMAGAGSNVPFGTSGSIVLNLNRQAKNLKGLTGSADNKWYPYAHRGFTWQKNAAGTSDSKTKDWRPQGITEFEDGVRSWLAVSWYHARGHKYKGVRVSFVDIGKTNQKLSKRESSTYLKYRHVLLVDKNRRPLAGVHAGGIVYRYGKLFIPVGDGKENNLFAFNIDDIEELSPSSRARYFDYRYILPQDGTNYFYDSVTNPFRIPSKKYLYPSFLSYDWDRESFVVGSYSKCSQSLEKGGVGRHTDSHNCFTGAMSYRRRIGWFGVDFSKSLLLNKNTNPPIGEYFTEMQGAVSDRNNLWISSSFSQRRSHLHVLKADTRGGFKFDSKRSRWCEIDYPAGLESLHITSGRKGQKRADRDIWTLTEFPKKGKIVGGNVNKGRTVFAVKAKKVTYDALLHDVSNSAIRAPKVSCH